MPKFEERFVSTIKAKIVRRKATPIVEKLKKNLPENPGRICHHQ
jgi:hypothetical protein